MRLGERRRMILHLVAQSGPEGMTWREIDARLDIGHGAISGALSALHRQGSLVRLDESRRRCRVYVLPQHVDGRSVEDYRERANRCPYEASVCEQIDAWRIEAEAKVQRIQRVYDTWNSEANKTGQAEPVEAWLMQQIGKVLDGDDG